MQIIGESAFGISFPFPSSFSQIVPAGSQANFFQLSKAVLRSALPPLPDFVARRLVKNLDQVRGAYEEFEREMRSIVEKRREEMASGEGEERTDILSAFVRANLREEGKNRLSDQELRTFSPFSSSHPRTHCSFPQFPTLTSPSSPVMVRSAASFPPPRGSPSPCRRNHRKLPLRPLRHARPLPFPPVSRTRRSQSVPRLGSLPLILGSLQISPRHPRDRQRRAEARRSRFGGWETGGA